VRRAALRTGISGGRALQAADAPPWRQAQARRAAAQQRRPRASDRSAFLTLTPHPLTRLSAVQRRRVAAALAAAGAQRRGLGAHHRPHGRHLALGQRGGAQQAAQVLGFSAPHGAVVQAHPQRAHHPAVEELAGQDVGVPRHDLRRANKGGGGAVCR
jgi:hypothetical protein